MGQRRRIGHGGRAAEIRTGLAMAAVFVAVIRVDGAALQSIDTGFTITQVRSARGEDGSHIVAGSYEGTVLGIGYDGAIRWTNSLSGFMNRDVWCDDLTGDGVDEVLAANADGSVYCLGGDGKIRWRYAAGEAPLNAVCVVRREGTPYVVVGGYDRNLFVLSAAGTLVQRVPSEAYSRERAWGQGGDKPVPPNRRHSINFLRRIRREDGSDTLAVHGVVNSLAARGSIYLFEPLEEKPFAILPLPEGDPVGALRVVDADGDGQEDILLGTSGMGEEASVDRLGFEPDTDATLKLSALGRTLDRFGYRVAQPDVISVGDGTQILVLFGSRLVLTPASLNMDQAEVLACRYAFNDLWVDAERQRILLASSQSGGSCVHVLDPADPGWKDAYQTLSPPGKLRTIFDNMESLRDRLRTFTPPPWERAPLPVVLLSDRLRGPVKDRVDVFMDEASSPVFLNPVWMGRVEDWDRSGLAGERYRTRRDRRKTYDLTREEVLGRLVPQYRDHPGVSFWAGHGNDPYLFSPETIRQVLDRADGKKTVLIYPELEDHSESFAFVLEDLMYPLAAYCRERNANLFIRSKHTFWQSTVYLPMWSRLLSGEFSDVFVPAMEETTDKTMELSLAARLGIWASGATDDWGARCARDNPSFDRLRQFSHQMVPNHFLRTMVYSTAYGARFHDNFPVDQDVMSLVWELIARGALYVPKRSEIVSFSPVHLSLTRPDQHYVHDGNDVKWTTFFDGEFERDNPFVFGRLNGSWPGAPVTAWDFSRYAAGVRERRLNFLPPYECGLVLITPPQQGLYAAADPPRGALADHLHPLYRPLLEEFYTDGRSYVSADGTQQYPADTFAPTIREAIRRGAKRLPVTVSGDVAWVAAQSAPDHLRLTMVDSGYLNPKRRAAEIRFSAVAPKRIRDLLTGEALPLPVGGAIRLDVPCGLFRMLDIELAEPL